MKKIKKTSNSTARFFAYFLILFLTLPTMAQDLVPRVVYKQSVSMQRPKTKFQVLQFMVNPKNEFANVLVKASGEADYTDWGGVDANGTVDRLLPVGTYQYRVVSDMYLPTEGIVTLDGGDNTHVEQVTLRPDFGYLEITGSKEFEGAEVFVDDKNIGRLPLKEGRRWECRDGYNLLVSMGDLYKPYTQTFAIHRGETTKINASLIADFKEMTLTVADNAEIYVDGNIVGRGHWNGKLKYGVHKVEARLTSHRPSETTLIVSPDTPTSYQLAAPTPITGNLYVRSTPSGAEIKLNGKVSGITPKLFNDILIGDYTIILKADGYKTVTKNVQIAEGGMENVDVALEEVRDLPEGTFVVNGIQFRMIHVEGGTFTMGATPEQEGPDDDEKPAHKVTLSSYMIGETEVTQALWEAVMGKSITQIDNETSCLEPCGLGSNYPMYDIYPNDCQEFIKKLKALTGQPFRLPTEAEWEYAARGGNKSKGYQYSGSNDLNEVAWYDDNSNDQTHPVATKKPNELGIYDMSGNVEEWCLDGYDEYNHRSQTNPVGPIDEYHSAFRGGGWYDDACYCRSADRNFLGEDDGWYRIGFRLVLNEVVYNSLETESNKPVEQVVTPSASGISEDNEPVYTRVKEGETLTQLARRKGVSVEQLYRLNPELRKNSIIKPNQNIRIQ